MIMSWEITTTEIIHFNVSLKPSSGLGLNIYFNQLCNINAITQLINTITQLSLKNGDYILMKFIQFSAMTRKVHHLL